MLNQDHLRCLSFCLSFAQRSPKSDAYTIPSVPGQRKGIGALHDFDEECWGFLAAVLGGWRSLQLAFREKI